MVRYRSCFLLLVVLAITGCQFFSGDQKVSEDHVRFERIVQAVETLRVAYEKQDLGTIQKLMVPLEGFQRLEGEIQRDFDTYSTISLTMAIERIYIRDTSISINVRWDGVWQRSPEESPATEHGHGVLVWRDAENMLLAEVEGANPFGKASR